MYVNNWLTRREMLTPDKVALVDAANGNRKITYREWNHSANRTANFLRDCLGIHKGERVAVLAANSIEYLDLWFACGKVGAVIQLLNWRLTPTELAGLVADAQPAAFIFSPEFAAAADSLRGHAPSIRHFVAMGQHTPLPNPSPPSVEGQKGNGEGGVRGEASPVTARGAAGAVTDVSFSEREHYPDTEPPEILLTWDDPWAICYTGGTTGLPKGAILTHGNITANSVNTVMSWGLTQDDIALLQMPLFHTGGFNVFTAPLVHIGGTSVVCKSFDVDQTFDLLRDEGITLLVAIPTMFVMMQQHPRWPEADFSRLKICGSGGASCPLPIIEKFRERGVILFTGYGLTDAGPNPFWLPPELRTQKPGSVGFPLMHIDLRIVDNDREVGLEEVGELLIRGPHVTPGYWNRPAETARAITPDGWLHTGDLARRDRDGCYYIVGRSKDMIKSGGENIYPAEVESVMHGHPAVAEAALIGVPDLKWGEVGRAIVVVKPGASLTAEELIAFCGTRLAKFKIPKSVVFVSSLPKTGAGKVDKKLLGEQYGNA